MDENYISFSPIYNSIHNVSKDGKTITASQGVSGTEEVVYKNELPSVVVSRNDDYETVMFVQKGDYMEFPGMAPFFSPTGYELNDGNNLKWISIEQDAENISFSFAANESDTDIRSALVYLLPRALYDSLKDNFMVLVNDDTYSAYEGYVILNVLQDYKVPAAPSVSFKGYFDMGDGSGLQSFADGLGKIVMKNPENPNGSDYIAAFDKSYLDMATIYLKVLEFTSDMTISFSPESTGLSSEPIDGKHYIKIASGASGSIEIKKGSDVIATCALVIY